MPWRVWRRLPDDPDRRRRFIVAAGVAVALMAVLVWVLIIVTGHNKKEIQDRPTRDEVATRAELYAALADVRASQRRACRVVNKRFAALAGLVEQQRPSAATTSYYRDHPDELARALAYFNDTVAILRPKDCTRQYPPPSAARFGLTKKQAQGALEHRHKLLREAHRKQSAGGRPPPTPVKPTPAPPSSSPAPGPQHKSEQPPSAAPPSSPAPPKKSEPPPGPLAPVCDLVGLQLPGC